LKRTRAQKNQQEIPGKLLDLKRLGIRMVIAWSRRNAGK
jgi:hypothetical protein